MNTKVKGTIRPIAVHLPQFHPIPENNHWWGKGFTEWTNVAKARPLFKGHYQPHLPSDLGFYDLRLAEARADQANLAKKYGIYGFCYYHYWFNGKRLLNQPIDKLLSSGEPDFPFMLCWANETWSRRWNGCENEILIKQEYSLGDDIKHIRFLCETFFADPRYIRVDGKPFIIIYRPALFPNIRETLTIWRNEAKKLGIGELYIGFMNHFTYKNNFIDDGFDCKIEFHPNFSNLPQRLMPSLKDRLLKKLFNNASPYLNHKIYRYRDYVDHIIKEIKKEEDCYPGITPGWDNSARKSKDATIFIGSSPQEYERWLQKLKETYKGEDTFLFINAWNEWAEGNHLEPCMKWGLQYLEATKRVLGNTEPS